MAAAFMPWGAVRTDTGRSLVSSGSRQSAMLAKLDDFAKGASFVLGHNLIAFDLPRLRAAKPGLRLLELPAIDTLRLSPLAFPRNPYHGLVKHYRDGGLKRGRVNDPELDSRLALKLFGDEREALAKAAPDLLAAWHRLCTPEPEGVDRALDGFFREVRASPAAVAGRGIGGDRTTTGECRLRARSARGHRGRGQTRLGAGNMPWHGCRWRAAIRSCRPGCATSFRKRGGWCVASGTPPAPIRPAAGAGSATTRAGS